MLDCQRMSGKNKWQPENTNDKLGGSWGPVRFHALVASTASLSFAVPSGQTHSDPNGVLFLRRSHNKSLSQKKKNKHFIFPRKMVENNLILFVKTFFFRTVQMKFESESLLLQKCKVWPQFSDVLLLSTLRIVEVLLSPSLHDLDLLQAYVDRQ